MLCRSVIEKGYSNVLNAISDADMAEIRIEETGLSLNEVSEIFASHSNLLATCRPVNLSDKERGELLKAAIDAGAKWVDIEIESEDTFTQEMVAFAKSKGCKVIISYHNYDCTPELTILNKIVDESKAKGADLIKLACQVNELKDNGRLMCLYAQKAPVLAIGMGKLGMLTRVAALKMGAPFTFVRGNAIRETAPGQLSENEIKTILNHL